FKYSRTEKKCIRGICCDGGGCYDEHPISTASFNCKQAVNRLERTICSNPELSKLDKKLLDTYIGVQKQLGEAPRSVFAKNQMEWLRKRTKVCKNHKPSCLTWLYKSRISKINSQFKKYAEQGKVKKCGFTEQFPKNMKVYAGGGHRGKDTMYPLANSKKSDPAKLFEVVVNEPNKPVALILGTYNPSIWNISWTQGTDIKAVYVTGYHNQAIAGLPSNIPMLNSTFENQGPCNYFAIRGEQIRKVNPASLKVFGKKASEIKLAEVDEILFGDLIPPNTKLITSKDNPPEKYLNKKHKTRVAGLNDLLKKGSVRKLTNEDVERWLKYKAEIKLKKGINSAKKKIRRYRANGYVILKKITLPGGMYGGHSKTFLLEKNVPYPDGDLAHSTLYDLNTMRCKGSCSLFYR
ncbi:MAG: hypothetical protein OEW87_12995, partial [Flavobacteriaceae bacterium]|nr:hypothetical protein [Flavobacteriaceae bacterium]